MSKVAGNVRLFAAQVFAAAICSGAFVAPAAAAMFTFESTFTATPNIVEVGERIDLHLTLTLLPTIEGKEAGIVLFGTVKDSGLDITDGTVFPFSSISSHSAHWDTAPGIGGFLSINAGIPSEFAFSISYETPGTYFPEFVLLASISASKAGDPTIMHIGGLASGRTVVSAVPGPIMGAGIPSIALALATIMLWRRRVSMLR